MNALTRFGWTTEVAQNWATFATDGLRPARVVADFGTSLKIALPEIHTAELSGKLAHYTNRENVPKVGDWVAVRLLDNSPAVIEHVVSRRSEIARKVAGKRVVKQIIAANVDVAFVLLALDEDFSIERLQRYLYQLSVHAIEPVIVLNKADKAKDIQQYLSQVRSFKLPVIVATAINGVGVDEVLAHIPTGRTAILLGSSGVGKSTITNKLLGREAQATQAVRSSDSTGRHTTVHRELFVLSNGGLLIDTPGIRELQLWGTEDELDENFDDIATLAQQCKYTTCTHTTEEGCAVRAALQEGRLDDAHYARYRKMRGELGELKTKKQIQSWRGSKKSRKAIANQEKDARREMREEF